MPRVAVAVMYTPMMNSRVRRRDGVTVATTAAVMLNDSVRRRDDVGVAATAGVMHGHMDTHIILIQSATISKAVQQGVQPRPNST